MWVSVKWAVRLNLPRLISKYDPPSPPSPARRHSANQRRVRGPNHGATKEEHAARRAAGPEHCQDCHVHQRVRVHLERMYIAHRSLFNSTVLT